jgi:hypothetical protein
MSIAYHGLAAKEVPIVAKERESNPQTASQQTRSRPPLARMGTTSTKVM